MSGAEQDDDVTLTPPARLLSQLVMYCDGEFDREGGEAVQNLIGDIENLAAEGFKKVKGKVTVEFAITREDGVYEIKPTLKIKAPEKPVPRTFMWADKNNNLTPENPRQMKFRFRQVEDGRATRVVRDS